MHDTNIHDDTIWERLDILSQEIEETASIVDRMELRQERVLLFIDYLQDIENLYQDKIGKFPFIKHMGEANKLVKIQTNSNMLSFYMDVIFNIISI